MTTLRHPLGRAVSEYRYMFQSAWVGNDFEAAIEAQPSIIDNSHYAHDLPPWIGAVAQDQLLVQNFDDLQADADEFAHQLLNFLDLPWQEDLPTTEKVRAAGTSRNRLASRLIKAGAMAARELGFATLVGKVKSDPRVRKILYRDFKSGEVPGPTRAHAEALIEAFEPDIQMAEEVFKKPLPHWRKIKPNMLGQAD